MFFHFCYSVCSRTRLLYQKRDSLLSWITWTGFFVKFNFAFTYLLFYMSTILPWNMISSLYSLYTYLHVLYVYVYKNILILYIFCRCLEGYEGELYCEQRLPPLDSYPSCSLPAFLVRIFCSLAIKNKDFVFPEHKLFLPMCIYIYFIIFKSSWEFRKSYVLCNDVFSIQKLLNNWENYLRGFQGRTVSLYDTMLMLLKLDVLCLNGVERTFCDQSIRLVYFFFWK